LFKYVLFVLIDDQAGSFDAFGAKPVKDCTTLVNLARPVCKSDGTNCGPGWSLRPGVDEKFTITINEEVPRQWYFVVANCNPKTGYAAPVTILNVDISSNNGIGCSTLSPQDRPDAGAAIVISLLVMLVILFGSTTLMFYRKAQSQEGGGGGGRSAGGLLAAARSSVTRYSGSANDPVADTVGHNNL
jgi:hypothetical protein